MCCMMLQRASPKSSTCNVQQRVGLHSFTRHLSYTTAEYMKFCEQLKFPALSCTVTEQREEVFTNAVIGEKQTIKRQTAEVKTPVMKTGSLMNSAESPTLLISFSSSSTVISTQVVTLSILTTISIILSTAATLWGAQPKIKDGIILVTDKVKEFLDKRRAATKSSPAAPF
jgi:hypothetical protein